MPALDDLLKEEFAQRIARGEGSKRDAYLHARMAAGIETPMSSDSASATASKLLKDPQVIARVAELTKGELDQFEPAHKIKLEMAANRAKGLVKAIALTKEWVIDQLIDNVSKAKSGDTPNLNAANKALELLGKHLGMFVEQPDTEKGKYVLRDRPLTADEWIDKHADRSN